MTKKGKSCWRRFSRSTRRGRSEPSRGSRTTKDASSGTP
ncbi:unnamed protein product [Effrenium voratum]|nr:unnamed protein product [Effrenium voratum]